MKILGRILIMMLILLQNGVSAQGFNLLNYAPYSSQSFLNPQKGIFDVSRLMNHGVNNETSYNGAGLTPYEYKLFKQKKYLSFSTRSPEGCSRRFYKTYDSFIDSFPVNNQMHKAMIQYMDPENHSIIKNGNYINVQIVSQAPFNPVFSADGSKLNYKWDWLYCLYTKFDSNFNIVNSQRFLVKGRNAELQYTDSGFVLGFMMPNESLQFMGFDWDFKLKKQTAFNIKDIVKNPEEFHLYGGEKGIFTLVRTNDNQGYWVVISGVLPPEELYYNYSKIFKKIDWNKVDKVDRKVLLLKLDNALKVVKTFQFNDGSFYGANFLNKRIVGPKNISYDKGKLSFLFTQYSQGIRFFGKLQFQEPDTCKYFEWFNYSGTERFPRHYWHPMPNNLNLIATVVEDSISKTELNPPKYLSLGFLELNNFNKWNFYRTKESDINSPSHFLAISFPQPLLRYGNFFPRDYILPDLSSYNSQMGWSTLTLWSQGSSDNCYAGYSLGFQKSPSELCSFYSVPIKLNLGKDTVNGGVFFTIQNLQEIQPQEIIIKNVQWEEFKYSNRVPTVICSPFQPYVSENSFPDKIVVCDKDTAVLTASVANLKRPFKILWNTGDTSVSIVVRKSGDYSFTINFPSGCSSPVSTNVTFATRKTQKPISDTTVCINQPVVFDLYADALKNNWTKVTWSDTLTGLVQQLYKPGLYRLKLENANGCTFYDSFLFSNYKTPQLPPQKDSIYCLNQDRILTYPVSVAKSIGPFLWSASINGESGTPNFYQINEINTAFLQLKSFRLVNDVPGKKVTVVQLKDGCGNLLNDTVISFVRYPLQVKFLGDTIACAGDSVRLFVEASGGDTGAYQFIWNDGSNKGSQIVDFPNQSKKYFVTLKDNCTLKVAKDTFDVQVVEKLTTTLEDNQICQGQSYQWIPKIQGGRATSYRYNWKVSDPIAVQNGLTQKDITIKPTVDFKGSFSVDDGICATAIDSGVVYVREQPDARLKQPATPACEPYVFNLEPLKLSQSPAAIWYWNVNFKGETQDANGVVNKIQYPVSVDQLYGIKKRAGKYQFGLIQTIGYSNGFYCADTFYTSIVEVKPRPKASGYSNPSSTNIDKPQVLIENTSVTDSLSFVMDKMGDRLLGKSNAYQFGDTGLFRFQILATDKNGCSDTANLYVRVEDVVKVFIPTAYTPNQDGLNEQFTLFLRGMKEYEMEIFDRWGGKVCAGNRQTMKSEKGFVSLVNCNLLQGVYVYNLRCINKDNQPLGFSGTFTVLP